MPCSELQLDFLVSTHIFRPSQSARNSHMSNLECFLLTIAPSQVCGTWTNEWSIHHSDNSKLSPCVDRYRLNSYSPVLSGPLIVACECCEYVGEFVCVLEKKMGNSVAKLHFQTLRQQPVPISQMFRSRRQVRKSMGWGQGQHNLLWSRVRGYRRLYNFPWR